MPKESSRSNEISRPTAAELRILAVLWERGPSTVRAIHDNLNRAIGYTTVLKFMQIMTEKGLLVRDTRGRSHIYRPAPIASQDRTQKHLLNDLLQKAFGGSMSKLVVAALSSERASSQEVAEIRVLLDKLDERPHSTFRSKGEKP